MNNEKIFTVSNSVHSMDGVNVSVAHGVDRYVFDYKTW